MLDGARESGLVLEVIEESDGRRIVRLDGALDLSSTVEVDAALARAFDDSPAGVRLDLQDVTFLDSSGLRGVIKALRLAEERNIAFEIVPGPSAVQRVFRVTGVADRVTFVSADGSSPLATPED